MRTLFISLLSTIIFLSACKSKSNTVTISSESDPKTKVSIAVNEALSSSDDMQNKVEELKKLKPLNSDQLKALLPEELMGMKRSSFNASSMMGFAVADAEYKSDDGKEIKLAIYDCAGDAGAGMYSLNYLTKMSIQSENDNGYTKSIDFNGTKAVETYEKNNESYNLTYVAGDRLLVNVSGEKIGLDAVKDLAKNLNLKVSQ